MKREWIVAVVAGFVMTGVGFGQASWEVKSPDDRVSLRLSLTMSGRAADYPAGQKRLYYEVSWQGRRILPPSPLGIVCSDAVRRSSDDALTGTLQTGDFVDDLTFVNSTGTDTVDEAYTMPHGKCSRCEERFKEKIVTFKNADGAPCRSFCGRAMTAWRFDISSRLMSRMETNARVLSEATGFRLPEGGKVWAHPYDSRASTPRPMRLIGRTASMSGPPRRAREGGRFRCSSAPTTAPSGD